MQLQELLSLIYKIDDRTRVVDFRMWAAARTMLGLATPSPDLKSLNWDHLLDLERQGRDQN